ncbi:MAG: hypothetical protein IT363_07415 [Methanoregulaceae archaeon]|nr:hypothetical protein [Methanoregulaceae archaeon]
MRYLPLSMLVVLVLIGCQSPAPETPAPTEPTRGTASQQPAGGDGGVTLVTPSAVPNAPVTGTESLQGGGSAVGTIAKDRAKDAANKASGSSLGALPEGD